MPYKNQRITHGHMQRITRRVWRLFEQWEKTQLEQDYNVYINERDNVQRIIDASGNLAWKKEFRLP